MEALVHDLPYQGKPTHYQVHFGSIIKIPKDVQTTDIAYKDLVCTEEDKEHIAEIITTMAAKSKFQLLFSQAHLKDLGAQINHVHPLKFISTIFSQERLKECMDSIHDDGFKWGGLMDGLGPSLTRESIKGKLDGYIADFAAEVKVDPAHIKVYFQNRDWENLVRFLMQS
jgi:hypothetical protein